MYQISFTDTYDTEHIRILLITSAKNPQKTHFKIRTSADPPFTGPHKPRTGCTGQRMNMHRPYWLHRPYTVYMAVLYTKQGTVKRSKMLVKSTHHPRQLPQQTRIGRRTVQTSNAV